MDTDKSQNRESVSNCSKADYAKPYLYTAVELASIDKVMAVMTGRTLGRFSSLLKIKYCDTYFQVYLTL